MKKIPFNKPCLTGHELDYIRDAVLSGKISGDGSYALRCQRWMENKFDAQKALLTTSCTDALEMASLLLDLKEGDEVILPSYTFVSTVNSFMLRGAKPVFVDIRFDTKNIDETLIENKITKRTKAIYVVHYAGISSDMDKIIAIADKHGLFVVEDAAQAVNAKYKGQFLGTLGTFGCFSFHETKNIMCGEGGAILINDKNFIERAEVIREKGTDRSKFSRGEVNKYTWRDIGSSYLPSDVLAAFLFAQLENMERINSIRQQIHTRYLQAFGTFAESRRINLPHIPNTCSSNYHMFYLLLRDEADRDGLIRYLDKQGITSIFHYVPLHASPMGLRLGYKPEDLPVTENVSRRLVRLPFYNDLTREDQEYVIASVSKYLSSSAPTVRSKHEKEKMPLLSGRS